MKLPEIIFGDNNLKISLDGCKGELIISPQYVLQHRCKESEFDPLRIHFDSYVVNPSIAVLSDGYHWAFPSFAGAYGYDTSQEKESDGSLPYDLLRSRDPIRWYQHFVLYEDDLHDFGYVLAECRVRVMKSFFFVLQQCYLRVDRQGIYTMSHRYFGVISCENPSS
ncbi:hypothetical protein WA538_003976 [Blastocystis sp. DL]